MHFGYCIFILKFSNLIWIKIQNKGGIFVILFFKSINTPIYWKWKSICLRIFFEFLVASIAMSQGLKMKVFAPESKVQQTTVLAIVYIGY